MLSYYLNEKTHVCRVGLLEGTKGTAPSKGSQQESLTPKCHDNALHENIHNSANVFSIRNWPKLKWYPSFLSPIIVSQSPSTSFNLPHRDRAHWEQKRPLLLLPIYSVQLVLKKQLRWQRGAILNENGRSFLCSPPVLPPLLSASGSGIGGRGGAPLLPQSTSCFLSMNENRMWPPAAMITFHSFV